MHKTPPQIYEQILQERPFCERASFFHDHICEGRSTMEHAFIYSGRQITDKWAIIRLCEKVHTGDGLNKEKNHFLSLRHATVAELNKYPKRAWLQLITYLNKKYANPRKERR